MKLPPIAEKFVVHFGEMGSRWGINRTSSRVFALLYLMPEPMTASEICDALGFSRSHVSAALKELQGWRLINLIHKPHDRRDHFTVSENVWEIARILIQERRRREIEPTAAMLKEAVEMEPGTELEQEMHGKVRSMHELMALLTSWYDDIQKMETEKLVNLLKLGSNIYSLYSKAGQVAGRITRKKKKT